MKLHLDEKELKESITQYISRDLGIDLSQREIDIQLVAGRGKNGHYANIELVKEGQTATDDPFSDAPPETPEPSPDDPAVVFDN